MEFYRHYHKCELTEKESGLNFGVFLLKPIHNADSWVLVIMETQQQFKLEEKKMCSAVVL